MGAEYSYRYDSLSHAKCRLAYHIVIVTKYRRTALRGFEDEVCFLVRDLATREGSGFKVIECGVGNGDHVHLLVRCKPRVAPGVLVGHIKSHLTWCLWGSHADELGRFYWGKKRVLFSAGYFCESVGTNRNAVAQYIKNQ